MSDIAISLKNVSKYYKLYDNPKDRLKEALHRKGKTYHKKFYATKNLNLEVKKGEILGIVGKNGSGKSTLLKLITRVLHPDEGTVEVNGNISALLELGSGFNPEFTGMQNIFFYGTILGFSKEKMNDRLADILAFADIGDFINQPLKTYSSGMKSRLGFAVAVHIDPEILILDEVLAVGDVLFRRKCYAKMEEFFKGGKTIIYVSHDANSVRELCTRAIFLLDGNIILDSDANTVLTYYEKYIFSKEKNREKIKHEIRQIILDGENTNISTTTDSISKEEDHIVSLNSNISDYYLPELYPKSTVEFKNYDVKISDFRILNSKKNKVNVLVTGEKYQYCYRVKFGLFAEYISATINIKTEKGVSISGASLTSFKQELRKVEEGDEIEVRWSFECSLLPDTVYYINTGVSAEINGEKIVLNRIVDALCFKVVSQYPGRYWGIVTLNQQPRINFIPS